VNRRQRKQQELAASHRGWRVSSCRSRTNAHCRLRVLMPFRLS
jgi:hypothetical protein